MPTSNRPHYHADTLRVLRSLHAAPFGKTREAMAADAALSVSGATARFRQLRTKPYGAVVECRQVGKNLWLYSLIHAPKRLRKAAGV